MDEGDITEEDERMQKGERTGDEGETDNRPRTDKGERTGNQKSICEWRKVIWTGAEWK